MLVPAMLLAAVTGGTGTIAGRVFNPTTGEYVRNATVEIKETGQIAVSGDGGAYRLLNVPAGTVTVTVAYTGHRRGGGGCNRHAGSRVGEQRPRRRRRGGRDQA